MDNINFSFSTPLLGLVLLLIFVVILVITFCFSDSVKKLFSKSNIFKNYFISLSVLNGGNEALKSLFSKLNNKYKNYRRISIISFAISCICLILLVSSPVKVNVNNEKVQGREIVLCLDVSGSMLKYDRQIIHDYYSIVKTLNGERISLQIFDSTSRTIFPLTNDYELINNNFDNILDVLLPLNANDSLDNLSSGAKNKIYSFLKGTNSKNDSASLIGDGLASCTLGFNNNYLENNKYIVFATDNILSGSPFFTLEESVKLAKEKGIKIYGLYSGGNLSEGTQYETDMRNVFQKNQEPYYFIKGVNSISDIISSIQKDQVTGLVDAQEKVIVDSPVIILVILLLSFFVYLYSCSRIKQ